MLATLEKARYRHSLALALAPLGIDQLKQELALSRAIVDVQSSLLSELSHSKSHGDEMNNKLVWLIEMLDPHIRRGQKLIAAAKKGHVAVHGTDAQKKAKAQSMLAVCKRIAGENPRWGITSILEQASEELHCVARTIKRNLPEITTLLRPPLIK